MGDFVRFLIRTSAFLSKEIYEILRQPRLILSLVVGPFLILLLFGIGYRNEARALRTIFVVEDQSPLAAQIQEFAGSLGEQLIYKGVTPDEAGALEQLRRGEVDLVAVAPPDAYETIRNNEQATFTLLHNEIDPFQADYVQYFGQIYVGEVNRRVLRTIAEEGQENTVPARDNATAARTSATGMREALERGDVQEAQRQQRQLDRDLDALELSVGASAGLLAGVQETLGGGGEETIRGRISTVRQATTDMEDIEEGQESYDEETQRAAEIETELGALESELGEFNRIDSQVVVSPFRSEAQSVAEIQPELSQYFAPSVIVLLLQHLAVTFAALSIVREVRQGSMELFRVSPISAGETLLGKYLSYLLFGAVVAIILTLLIIFGLGVPMLGSWVNYAAVIAALLFTSLGYGFFISTIVDTDSQAVQYAMILLLTSVFFSGFFLGLETLWEPVRVVSWSLPATYSILLLQDIMLRGTAGTPLYLAGLVGLGAALYLLSWFLLRRKMAHA
jgi:ABC-2 type transport system permease protein